MLEILTNLVNGIPSVYLVWPSVKNCLLASPPLFMSQEVDGINNTRKPTGLNTY